MPHTPEPWHLHFQSVDEVYIRHFPKAEDHGLWIPIALLTDDGNLSPGELECNAELLVRAPRMLQALISMVGQGRAGNFVGYPTTSVTAINTEGHHGIRIGHEVLAELKNAGVF